ncbi:MAG: folylpolyglutamate synthase/dihydrofolate synthase family protein [Planctomycetia bacterium]|nr:folylpolyglutamate synthase/dihydrofolate synthase family protein [Planctomycetia bacterium]
MNSRINWEQSTSDAYSSQVFKLERVEAFYRLLGSPAANVPIVHVTGTKGKGSTSAMIAGILQRSGNRVGLFQSPHLVRLEERFQIDRKSCRTEVLAEILAEIHAVVRRLDADEEEGRTQWGRVTWFEIVTMAAMCFFDREEVDWVVLEVGMGGRLDSTNICHPKVCVITNISLDHMVPLGNTVEAIAREKGGIIKPGVPVVSGVTQPSARAVIAEIAREKKAPLWEISETPFLSLPPLAMPGEHQKKNAALALQVVEILRRQGWDIPEIAVKQGLAETTLPGRLEILHRRPYVVVDVAHNEISIETTLRWLEETFPDAPKEVLFAVSGDKDWKTMLRKIAAVADSIHLTQYRHSRSALAQDLLTFCRQEALPATAYSSAWEAFLRLYPTLSPKTVLLITGSFFLIGEIYPSLQAFWNLE